jgi:hypothetical protein
MAGIDCLAISPRHHFSTIVQKPGFAPRVQWMMQCLLLTVTLLLMVAMLLLRSTAFSVPM